VQELHETEEELREAEHQLQPNENRAASGAVNGCQYKPS
jgi:hypothetical protein